MNVEQLIQLNIELEGLLRVLADRDNEDAKQLLQLKYNEFTAAFETAFSESAAIEIAEKTVLAEPSVETEIVETQIAEVVKDESQEVKEEPEVVEPKVYAEPEVSTADEIAASRQNEMRVDEMLTRREARDLRKAFTLNDKFRFRRELFSNNDAEFADTLNVLSAMQNLDEATEYMRDDLGWDMDSDDVKDFVNIVNNHFATV